MEALESRAMLCATLADQDVQQVSLETLPVASLASVGEEYIIDNADSAGVSFVGSWGTGPAGNFYGTDFAHDSNSGKGTKTATFTPDLAVGGTYEVFMWWKSLSGYAANVPVTINHVGGSDGQTINQQADGGQWNLLGTYVFDAGTAGNVTISNVGTSQHVVADAVRFVRIETGPDTTAPTADLDSPANASSAPISALNTNGYLDLSFVDAGGIEPATIDGDEISIAGAGVGTAVLSGMATDQGNGIYRFPFTGDFAVGAVDVTIEAATFADLAGNPNVAEVESFTVIVDPPVDLIIDNAAGSGISFVGSWGTGAGGNFYGANFAHDSNLGKGTKTATFTPDLPVGGTYEVYMWWKSLSGYASNVPVTVNHASGSDGQTINQQADGGQWNLLGTYVFDAGATGSVTISNAGTNQHVIADAVRFVRIETGPDTTAPTADLDSPAAGSSAPISALNANGYLDVSFVDAGGIDPATIDGDEISIAGAGVGTAVLAGTASPQGNGIYRYAFTGDFATGTVDVTIGAGTFADLAGNANVVDIESFTVITDPPVDLIIDNADSAGISFVGSWGTGPAGNFYGTNFAHDSNSGKGTKTVTFTPDLPVGGTYEVYMWWKSLSAYASNVPVTVTHAGGSAGQTISQRADGGQWNLLGTYVFEAGESGFVTISNAGTNGTVIADAVRFVRIETGPDTTAPTADLDSPATGSSAPISALNANGYLDVSFVDAGGIDPATIDGDEISIAGAGVGTAVLLGTATDHGNGTYRYAFTGDFATGGVDVTFEADTFADLAGNANAVELESFTVIADPPVDLIIDNAAGSGVSFVGSWGTGAGGNFYGANFAHDSNSGKGTKTVTFTPDLPVGGTYEVYMWWKSLSGYASNVPVTINHVGGNDGQTINQQADGGQWNLLGTYVFDAGTAGNVTISTAGTSQHVIADAVRFVRIETGPDTTAPTADLDSPANGTSAPVSALNAQGYVDITFVDAGGIDPATINGDEISIAGAGVGTAVLSGTATDQGNGIYRYVFTGDFATGDVDVTFEAGTFADLAGNANAVELESFTVIADPPVDLIIDNAAGSGVSFVGSWGTGAGGNFYGANFAHDDNSGKGTKTATFTPDLPVGGTYEVYMWWKSLSGYASNAPVTVNHASGSNNQTINQQADGGQWNLLGTYVFAAGTAGHVTISNAGTSQHVVADAVRFVRIETGPDTTAPTADLDSPANGSSAPISALNANGYLDVSFSDAGGIDPATIDGDEISIAGAGVGTAVLAGTASSQGNGIYRFPFTGELAVGAVDVTFEAGTFADLAGNANAVELESFTVTADPPVDLIIDNAAGSGVSFVGSWGTGAGGNFYGANFAHDDNSGKGTKTATFTPDLPVGGTYEVYMWWKSLSGYASNVPVTVNHASGSNGQTINQQANGGQWNLLGTFVFDVGTSGSVTISNAGTNQHVVADAVRFVRIDTLVPEIQIEDETVWLEDGVSTVDFGIASLGEPVTKTITVRNLGGANLNLTQITQGDLPAGFTLVQGFGEISLAPNASTTFQIRLDADTEDTFTGTLSIASNDGDENPFDIMLTGAVNPPSEFLIEVLFVDNNMTASQRAIFTTAAERWSQIILGDIPDVFVSGFYFEDGQGRLVDDLIIEASAPSIDGRGGILGQAGPRYLRSGSYLPAMGIMRFDSADLNALEGSGQLLDVILHEMGHVLGIGTIWEYLGLLTGKGGSDPRFLGAQATAEYNAIFGASASSVPVANVGGSGTRDSHWRESTFNNELMTGSLNPGANPLSRVTSASLADLGYIVNVGASDAYSPPGSLMAGSSLSAEPVSGADAFLWGGEAILTAANVDSDHSRSEHIDLFLATKPSLTKLSAGEPSSTATSSSSLNVSHLTDDRGELARDRYFASLAQRSDHQNFNATSRGDSLSRAQIFEQIENLVEGIDTADDAVADAVCEQVWQEF